MSPVALVTGANSGIGFALARALAKRGDTVILVCRDPSRGHSAKDAIARVAAGRAPVLMVSDLSSQAQIRSLAAEARGRFQRIDVLVNNAGAAFRRREVTSEGIERTFATNHLAPFLLTTLLLDLLMAAPAGRVVTVGADAYPSSLDFDNLQGEKRYSALGAYFKSKLANILFTVELARRLDGSPVTANCCGPGAVRTNFGRRAGGALDVLSRVMWWMPNMQTPDEGARTPFYLATSPAVAGISGRFFLRCRERRTKPVARDRAIAARLWELSESLTGVSAPAASA